MQGDPLDSLPSFPWARNKSSLTNGCGNGDVPQLSLMEMCLAKRNMAMCTEEEWKLRAANPPAKKYPSTLVLPPGFKLSCRPAASDCGCAERTLGSLAVGSAALCDEEEKDDVVRTTSAGPEAQALGLSAQDVEAFSTQPLRGLSLEKHVKSVQLAVPQDMLAKLPFAESFAKLPAAKSEVAQSMLKRMEQDLAGSYTAASHATASRLVYLDAIHTHCCIHTSHMQARVP